MQQPMIVDLDDPSFDPFAADGLANGEIADPWPRIHDLMRQAPVHAASYRSFFNDSPNVALEKFNHFSVFGWDAVHEIYSHPERFSNEAHKHTLGLSFGQSISTMDAPEHPRYRRIFQRVFLPQIVGKWGDTLVDPVIGELLGRIKHNGHADLVRDFTLHYPFQIIYRQLGLPEAHIATFHKLAVAQTAYPYDLEHAREAGRKLGDYFTPMVLARRNAPGEDLISLLASVSIDGEMLPVEIVVSFLRQLVNAGGDTTYRGTSALLTALLSNPEQLEKVRADRTLVAQAVDEALRWEGPVLATRRMAATDLTLSGVEIPAGSIIDVVQGSANRDERRHVDPDTFNIYRERKTHNFAFAMGPHICIGQHLAKIEMSRALNGVFNHLPNLRLDKDMPPPEMRGFNLRVAKHIHVRFD